MRFTPTFLLLLIGASLAMGKDAPHGVIRGSEVIDIALTQSGGFVSCCQDTARREAAGVLVGLYRDGELFATTLTGPDGWFVLPNVPAGAYVLRSTGWENSVRLWTSDAAPPGAEDPIVLVLNPSSPVRLPPAPIQQAGSNSVPALTAQTESVELIGTLPNEVAEAEKIAESSPIESAEAEPFELNPLADDGGPNKRGPSEPIDTEANEIVKATDAASDVSSSPESVEMRLADAIEMQIAEVVESTSTRSTGSIPPEVVAAGSAESMTTEPVVIPAMQTSSLVSDKPFNPFATAMADEVAPAVPEPGPAFQAPANNGGPGSAVPQQDYQPPNSAWCPPAPVTGAPMPVYRVGPTIGDVVLGSAGVAGITLGTIALYKYDRDSERRPVSP